MGSEDAIKQGKKDLETMEKEVQSWDELVAPKTVNLPDVKHSDLGSIFFTSGTTGLSKGVMMPHAHMYLFADETVSLTRLTSLDTYMSCGPLFHGNSQFLAAYPALIAGSKYVLQERFSASEWINQIRDSGATVTNFILQPLSFLSGVFYTIDRLPEFFQSISLINPFFHIINIFRYGFLGKSDGDLYFGVIYLPLLAIVGWVISYYLYKIGYKIKS